MSTQAGIWNFDAEPINRLLLSQLGQRMDDSLPDSETVFVDGAVGMLYRAFCTTPESRQEGQPYVCNNGNVIMWDGRLDNRDELIPQVWNELGDNRTDLAVVAAAFQKWGPDTFQRLIGDWAISIWDPREKALILARDYIGVRHLYYYWSSKGVTWSSQLAPLAISCSPLTLCDEYVARYLAQSLRGNLTPYREVLAVPPGTTVQFWSNKKMNLQQYWAFNPRVKTRYKTDAEYEEHFRYVFRQAVRRRLRSCSPILADLSGGYDSSSIVCMADDVLSREGAHTPSLDTFSYTCLDEPEGDDVHYFTKVEEKRGRVGHRTDIKGSGDSFALEYPAFIGAPVLGYRKELEDARSEIMKKGNYRVTLSGFGGDELLGQALEARVQMADFLMQFRPLKFAKQLTAWSLRFRYPWSRLLIETLRLLLPSSVRARITHTAQVQQWINSKFAQRHSFSVLLLPAAEGSWRWLPSARDFFQTHARLAGILTNVSSSSSEVRYPYLDQTFVEFLMSIPADQLLRPNERRSLMRRAMADILPKEILSRRTKQVESRFLVVTLQKHWKVIERTLKSPLSSRLGYINRDEFRAALIPFRNGHMSSAFCMQTLMGLFLEVWLQHAVACNVIKVPSFATRTLSPELPSSGIRVASTSAHGNAG